jgi:hypothetical protein
MSLTPEQELEVLHQLIEQVRSETTTPYQWAALEAKYGLRPREQLIYREAVQRATRQLDE